MTQKLFYEDPYMRSFSAHVIRCDPAADESGRWEIVLDRTAFYPEGGGQPGDTGVLGNVRVLDTQESGDEVVHICSAPLEAGQKTAGEIDWDRRFDFMQQHSGEHILSGLAHRHYGYENVGFHMGAQAVTVDLSGVLSWEQLQELEREINEIIWQDVPILEQYPSAEELSRIDYRSKKELSGWVRLIDIPGADLCACCGMHVARTGAIGLVQILSVQRFHEGVRIEMLSGKRAYDYARMNAAQNRSVSGLLSAQLHETASHVQRILEEKAALEYDLTGLRMEWLGMQAASVRGQNPALLFVPGLNPDGVRMLCTKMMAETEGVCGAFSQSPGKGWLYAVARLEPEKVRAMNAALSGRGGGKPGFAQGSLQAEEHEIRSWFTANTILPPENEAF